MSKITKHMLSDKRNALKFLSLGVLVVGLLIAPAMMTSADHDPFDGVPQSSVLICHQKGKGNDGYVANTPSISATGGNLSLQGHQGAAHSGDIIPPFHFDDNGNILTFPGQNWTPETEDIWDNGTCTGDGVIELSADIEVTKTVNNATPSEGDTVTYTVTVTNNGPDDATNVEVNDLLPSGVTFNSATTAEGTYDEGTGVWSISILANGASVTLEIEVIVDTETGGTTITNTATGSGDEADNVSENNSDSVGITVDEPQPLPECSDGEDNDGDGFIDQDDKGCWTDLENPNTYDPEDDDEVLLGCTVQDATNYDPQANELDNSCVFENPTGTIVIKKVVTEGGDTEQEFLFNPSWSGTDFTLSHGEEETFELMTGTYSIREHAFWGWSLEEAVCTSTDQNDESTISAIDISEDETVTCTFTNTQQSNDNQCTVSVFSETSNVVLETGQNATETYVHPSWTHFFETSLAKWIWKSALVENPSQTSIYTFQNYLSWTGDLVSASVDIASDDQFNLYINGTLVAEYIDIENPVVNHVHPGNEKHIDVTSEVVQGINEIQVEVANIQGSSSPYYNPAGLSYVFTVTGEGDSCQEPPLPQCSDGVDNDQDGLVDHPSDPGCTSPEDDDETDEEEPTDVCLNIDGIQETVPEGYEVNNEGMCTEIPVEETFQCSDGIDNDEDGKTDAEDSGCWTDPNDPETYNENDDDETDPTDVCENISGIQTDVPNGYHVEDSNQCVEDSGSSGGGGVTGSVGGRIAAAPTPQVLGATTTACTPVFDQYLKRGARGGEVFLLQYFLNSHMNAGLTIDGIFGPATERAVKAFQQMYFEDIIMSWVPPLSPNTTGWFYKTTLSKANQLLGCPSDPVWLEDPQVWFSLPLLETTA